MEFGCEILLSYKERIWGFHGGNHRSDDVGSKDLGKILADYDATSQKTAVFKHALLCHLQISYELKRIRNNFPS